MAEKESAENPSSPHSNVSLHTDSLDLAIKSLVQTSIEQLYQNIYDIQSSDHSPTRGTSISFDNESRMDSELRHLVGGDFTDMDVKKEVINETKEHGSTDQPAENGFVDSNSSNIGKTHSRFVSSKSRSRSRLLHERNSSKRSAGRAKPPGKTQIKPINSRASKLDYSMTDLITSIENPKKLSELVRVAIGSFEEDANGKPKLEMVMFLHVLAARLCSLGEFRNAISILEHSIEMLEGEGKSHSLAKFSGYMQLGDVYATLGEMDKSLKCYTAGMEIQRGVLGDKDPLFGITCRHVAEAHVQALRFDEAENLCQIALRIHKQNGLSDSLEEAEDRKLLGLIFDSKGNHENSLEHYVLASMAMVTNGREMDVASIDCTIGDAYSAMARYDEAICSYQKALTVFRSIKGEFHPVVASAYTRMAHLFHKVGKLKEAKSCRENALRICKKRVKGIPVEEFASVILDISSVFLSMDDLDQALELLQIAHKIYSGVHGQKSLVAGVEAQIGVVQYMKGSYSDSYKSFKTAVSMLRKCGEKKSILFGITLNQMGLACIQCNAINEAVELFEEAKDIMEKEYGPCHHDTLAVYSNLAGTYDAIGRLDDAIKILDYVVGVREEKLGTANPQVHTEKQRLLDLLKGEGMIQTRKFRSLETLLENEYHANVNDKSRSFMTAFT